MKILYVTTVGITMSFFTQLAKRLIEEGHTIDIATNKMISDVPRYYYDAGCKVYLTDSSRSPFNMGNVRAIKQIRSIAQEGSYDIVHCHTPIAAACTRLACKKLRKKGVKVFYTAHGFHFFKGAPKANWLIYYPIEKICSKYTDVLVTINTEDHILAQKKLRAKSTVYVPGVGVNIDRFSHSPSNADEMRGSLGIPSGKKVILSVGELNRNKNHSTVIRAISDLDDAYYVIAGCGELDEELKKTAEECGVSDRVILAGYRTDIENMYAMADIYTLPSHREGLNVSLMEAMACGLPCVVGRIRGNTDLIDEGLGGAFFAPSSVEECKSAILSVLNGDMKKMGAYNAEKVKKFSLDAVNGQMIELYNKNIE